jgi:fumarate hydratase, class II
VSVAQKRETRTESDTMGPVELPAGAYWGAQTQRAVENFGISAKRIPSRMIRALGLVKGYAAEINAELGLLEPRLADAIARAAAEVAEGKWNEHFPVDVFQTGSGTSWNMNANEVITNRANELLGSALGAKTPIHPNDHVNRGQSSNDVIPTAIHIADREGAADLVSSLEALHAALAAKADEHRNVIKLGRTHLQDAVPMTLGQEISGWAAQIRKGIERIQSCYPRLEELALGGTAVGTGLNAHPELASRAVARIAAATAIPFRRADNTFEAMAARDAQAELMGALSVVAGSLLKIANDLRLLASGPRGALGEIVLPALQPGSSIMPGKVNPVIPEMVIQAAAYVMGKHTSVAIAASSAPLELNIMMPLVVSETQEALSLLSATARVFAERCIDGLEADAERCEHWIEWSLALVTPLATRIGYDKAAAIAYRAFREKRTVRAVLLDEKVLPAEEIDRILDPRGMA